MQVDGGIRSGRDVVIGALLGADEFGVATAALVAEGCVMMRKCHLNTCPVGVATQDPELRRRFVGKPEDVVTFFMFLAEEVRELMAKLGFRNFNEMIGRTDKLAQRSGDQSPEGAADRSVARAAPCRTCRPEPRPISARSRTIDSATRSTIGSSPSASRRSRDGETVALDLPIRNVNRTVGAMLSGEVARRYGDRGLPDGTIRVRFAGTAGQSFGAFLARGVAFELEGAANDYVGKGLSGGRLVVYPPKQSKIVRDKSIIVGNTVLYGAISGECYFSGVAGERFAVRNSGAVAVVEGAGIALLRIHDRRHRRRPRRDRQQFRRRHERRHRLRARRKRHVPAALQPRDGRSRADRRRGRAHRGARASRRRSRGAWSRRCRRTA